jgi:hypothetical protein
MSLFIIRSAKKGDVHAVDDDVLGRKQLDELLELCGMLDRFMHGGLGFRQVSRRSRGETGVTNVRMRREDRASISSHPLADLGG